MTWEKINNYTTRAKVYGGWLVKIVEDVYQYNSDRGWTSGNDWRPALAFVPDPKHVWDLSVCPTCLGVCHQNASLGLSTGNACKTCGGSGKVQ
jgi:hypothetical protein